MPILKGDYIMKTSFVSSKLPVNVLERAIAIGNFDGIHLGHMAVLRETINIARAKNLVSTVMTFEPHPLVIFKPELPPFRITPLRSKLRFLALAGIDECLVMKFNRAFANISAQEFVSDLLVKKLAAAYIITGEEFNFGKNREGTSQMLSEMAKTDGFTYIPVKPITNSGVHYSSTQIRSLIREGKLKEANKILGHHFEVEAKVIRGNNQGEKLGYPTTNMIISNQVLPPHGVYAVRIQIAGENEWHDGVANFGVKPTFGENRETLEVHIFEFSGKIYGKRLRVRMLDYIRPERKFDKLEALKEQIMQDCVTSQKILGKND